MSIAHLTALDALWVALSVFLVVVSLAVVYLLVRVGSALTRLAASVERIEEEGLPVVRDAEAAVERANAQLDKVERVTDSAADAVAGLDAAARAFTSAVARPARRVSAFATGFARGGEEGTG